MLKKRIIFTLLYDDGYFMLSRNFRLQKVGNLEWLQKNYNFSKISFFIDELIVLDVTRKKRNLTAFCETLKALTKGCFVPIAAGGGIRSKEDAKLLLRSGADKVVINTALFTQPDLVTELVKCFGQQCVIGSVDLKRKEDGNYQVLIESGTEVIHDSRSLRCADLKEDMIGECYLNSIDQDGTGQGYDFDMLNFLPQNWTVPIIISGGAGNSLHLVEGLKNKNVDAVATAHLFNFVGDGLKQGREKIFAGSIRLACWPLPANL
jgi:cyclase